MVGLFEQYVAEPKLRGTRRSTESRGARADYRDLDGFAHAPGTRQLKPNLQSLSEMLTNARTGILSPSRQPPGEFITDATRTNVLDAKLCP